MQKELWQMTPKQYINYRINLMSKEYNESKIEIIECFGYNWFYKEFLKIIEQAASEGKRIPDNVLDKLEPMNRQYIIKFYNKQHRDYIPPEIRKQNKEYSEQLKQIRNKKPAI